MADAELAVDISIDVTQVSVAHTTHVPSTYYDFGDWLMRWLYLPYDQSYVHYKYTGVEKA